MEKDQSLMARILNEFKEKRYESEFTEFLRGLKQQKPQLEEEQRKSRAIWWDHEQDADSTRRAQESRVRQQAYVYQTKL